MKIDLILALIKTMADYNLIESKYVLSKRDFLNILEFTTKYQSDGVSDYNQLKAELKEHPERADDEMFTAQDYVDYTVKEIKKQKG